MEVIQFIQKLLFLEDCVIIPGLGGFVSQYRPAVIDKSSGTFIPPAREIVFNGELVQNDGTLVNYIAKQLGITIEAARKRIDLFVDDAKTKLENNDPVLIDGIGQFMLDKNFKIRFQADAGAGLFLESFGLTSFHLREVVQDNHTGISSGLVFSEEIPSRRVEFPASATRRSPSNQNLRRIAIAMPLLIVFSLLPYHSRFADTLTSSPASMAPELSLFRLNYPDAMQNDTAKAIIFPITDNGPEMVVTPDRLISKGVRSEDVKTVEGKFPVIAGCFKVKSNADRLHKQLIEKGYPAAITTSRTGLYKVSIQSFDSRLEALTGFDQLKRAEPGMQLWVAL